jgi:hypothetical protein
MQAAGVEDQVEPGWRVIAEDVGCVQLQSDAGHASPLSREFQCGRNETAISSTYVLLLL